MFSGSRTEPLTKNKGGEADKKLAIFSNYCGDLPFVPNYF
eukprot:UN05034